MDLPEETIKRIEKLGIQKHPGSICITNYKGGVGKTTVTVLLAYYLAHLGKKVLMFDIDPQCSLSLAVGFNIEKVNKTDFTIYQLVNPKYWHNITKVPFRQYVDNMPDGITTNLKIIKGSFDVDELDMLIIRELVENEGSKDMLFNYCRNMLNEFSDFDYILVDCPPNKMYLTQAMLRACSYFLTVTIPDGVSIDGMPRLLRWVRKIPNNEKPKLLGCILNCINRAGGNEHGTINQQQATKKLFDTIQSDLTPIEKDVLEKHPFLEEIPRLDSISRFLGQSANINAWHDLKKSTTDQKTVSEIMMKMINRIKHRIDTYAKI